jgi:hypothetical protein
LAQEFLDNYLHWEAKYFKDIAVDAKTGLTFDHRSIHPVTGLVQEETMQVTSLKSEALHLALLARSISGDARV